MVDDVILEVCLDQLGDLRAAQIGGGGHRGGDPEGGQAAREERGDPPQMELRNRPLHLPYLSGRAPARP